MAAWAATASRQQGESRSRARRRARQPPQQGIVLRQGFFALHAGRSTLALASPAKVAKLNPVPAPLRWAAHRHDVFSKVYADKYPESFDPAVPRDLIFSGKYKLTDVEPETGVTVGKLVLSPTRTYAPIIKQLLQVGLGRPKGLVMHGAW